MKKVHFLLTCVAKKSRCLKAPYFLQTTIGHTTTVARLYIPEETWPA